MDKIILVQEEPRNNSELVEVQISTAGTTRVNFPDVQQLRSLANQQIVIQGIRLVTANVLSNAPISGNATAPDTEIKKCVLVIYSDGWERGHYIPLFILNDVNSPTSSTPFRYAATKFASWKNVDWNKSYILYANNQSSAGAPYSFLFDVEYTKLDANGVEIKTGS